MAETSARRSAARRPWLLGALALAVVAAVLLLSFGGDDPAGTPPSSGQESGQESGSTPTTIAGATPEEFCESFLAFVDASGEFSSRLDVESGEALVEVTRRLFALPTPVGMSPGARASFDALVAGTLPQVESIGVTVDAAPDPANAAEPDQAGFDAYLQEACPA